MAYGPQPTTVSSTHLYRRLTENFHGLQTLRHCVNKDVYWACSFFPLGIGLGLVVPISSRDRSVGPNRSGDRKGTVKGVAYKLHAHFENIHNSSKNDTGEVPYVTESCRGVSRGGEAMGRSPAVDWL